MRKRPRHALWLLLLAGTGALAWAAAPEAPPQADLRVARLLEQVSADRIERDIRQLVAFGTRSTLSAEAPNRGIGAAQRWVQ